MSFELHHLHSPLSPSLSLWTHDEPTKNETGPLLWSLSVSDRSEHIWSFAPVSGELGEGLAKGEGEWRSAREWDDRWEMRKGARETYDGREDEGRSGHGREISRDIGQTATFKKKERRARRETRGGGRGEREGREDDKRQGQFVFFRRTTPSSLYEPLDKRSPRSLYISPERTKANVRTGSREGQEERRGFETNVELGEERKPGSPREKTFQSHQQQRLTS